MQKRIDENYLRIISFRTNQYDLAVATDVCFMLREESSSLSAKILNESTIKNSFNAEDVFVIIFKVSWYYTDVILANINILFTTDIKRIVFLIYFI